MNTLEKHFSQRPVREDDLEAISAFASNEEELFFFYPKAAFPLTPRQLKTSIEARADSTVVERDGEVIGFANFYRWETGGICSIGNVVISPKARGLGAGRFLMRVMISLAVEKYQAKEIRVACFNRNTSALLLYQSLGFKLVTIEERHDKQHGRFALIHMNFHP